VFVRSIWFRKRGSFQIWLCNWHELESYHQGDTALKRKTSGLLTFAGGASEEHGCIFPDRSFVDSSALENFTSSSLRSHAAESIASRNVFPLRFRRFRFRLKRSIIYGGGKKGYKLPLLLLLQRYS